MANMSRVSVLAIRVLFPVGKEVKFTSLNYSLLFALELSDWTSTPLSEFCIPNSWWCEFHIEIDISLGKIAIDIVIKRQTPCSITVLETRRERERERDRDREREREIEREYTCVHWHHIPWWLLDFI